MGDIPGNRPNRMAQDPQALLVCDELRKQESISSHRSCLRGPYLQPEMTVSRVCAAWVRQIFVRLSQEEPVGPIIDRAAADLRANMKR